MQASMPSQFMESGTNRPWESRVRTQEQTSLQ